MTDFAIRIKNLPNDAMFGGNPENLKGYLKEHFEALIKDDIKKLEPTTSDDFDDISKDKMVINKWQIADINFGLSTMTSTNYLERLSNIRTQFVMNNIRMTRTKDGPAKEKIKLTQVGLKEKFAKLFDEY